MQHRNAALCPDGRWRYIVNGRCPLGYCSTENDLSKWDDERAKRVFLDPDTRARYIAHSHRFHDDGHETELQARECHKRYRLDFDLRFYTQADQQRRCASCGEWTQGIAQCGIWMQPLCIAHQTREIVAELLPVSSEQWGSI